MHKLILAKLKILILHATMVGIVFGVLIAVYDNKNTMIISMHSNISQPLEAEFYYTTEGVAFGNDKRSRRYKVKGDKYYFRLPALDKIQYARLDPSKRKSNITIKDVQVISSQWFTTSIYTLDIKKSEIVDQIENYTIKKDGIQFSASGRDPKLNINFTRTIQSVSRNRHIDTFLIALLVYGVLLYIYTLYKTKEFTPFLSSKLILYGLFLAFSLFKVDYYKEHVHHGHIPDTIAHLSYIKSIHDNHEIFPKFENMYMITNKNAGNYLGHPPLYYYLMNVVYDDKYSVVGNIDNFRMINTIIFAATVLLLFYLSFTVNMSLLAHFTYLTVITSIPMHAYLGSSTTNDNLAILGGVLFIVGLQKILHQIYTNSTYLILGLGIFIAYFSKLTAALLIFFAGIFFLIYLIKSKQRFQITKTQILILTTFIVPTIIYQSYLLLHYHALVPTLNVTHPEGYKQSVYYIQEALREYKSITEFLGNYWSNIHSGWFGIHSHHSFVKLSILSYIGLFILHIFAIISLFLKCKNEYCILGKLSLLALISVMIVQFLFSYKAHLHSGYMGGLQVRYLLPFMFSFAIMASLFVERFHKIYIFAILSILFCIQALYSDFFYFLKYYI